VGPTRDIVKSSAWPGLKKKRRNWSDCRSTKSAYQTRKVLPLMSKNSAVSLEAHDNFRDPPAEMVREGARRRGFRVLGSAGPSVSGHPPSVLPVAQDGQHPERPAQKRPASDQASVATDLDSSRPGIMPRRRSRALSMPIKISIRRPPRSRPRAATRG